jgi:cytochrome c oxidase subunit 2
MVTPASLITDGNASSRVPLDYFFQAAGPASVPVRHLNWALTALAVGVCVIIAVLLAIALWRRRPGPGANVLADSGRGTHGVLIGTAISIAALAAATFYTLWTLGAIVQPDQGTTLRIEVTGYDWWWKIAYPAQGRFGRFATANEIHIPVGVPVQIDLRSADVLHAFWVPALAGKTQTVPGQVNRQWIEADKPGIYRGQCSQYCGAQHAHMGVEVVAETPADFDAWRARQLAPASAGTPPQTALQIGMHLFEARCAGCHTVRGTSAEGVQAPDLTHLATRRTIAAVTLPNTRENLLAWITAPQRIKPEALMPGTTMNTADANALLDYLATLK